MTKTVLEGIKVLDLSRVLAGPWCTQILADLGADVIKVENPKDGDDTRGWGPPFISNDAGETLEAAYYLCANRNKRSIAINLRDEEGRSLVRDMALQSDIIVENYKTDGLKKFGLDYHTLSKQNPNLIYCSITGFGQDGPLRQTPGYDFLIQAMGGLMSVTGDEAPTKVGVPVVDLFTGVYAAGAVMAALIARDKGSGGQFIDMALFDVQLAMMANQASNYLVSGNIPGSRGNAHPNIVPYQDFPTCDGRIAVAVGNDGQFGRFANVLGCSEWAEDPRFATNRARVENREILIAQITVIMSRRSCSHWESELNAHGVPCGPINKLDNVFSHAQTHARQLQFSLSREDGVSIPSIANPMRLTTTPPQYQTAPPKLGQHTQEVLQQRLCICENDLKRLYEAGIIA